jgi:4-hydroxybenzoate polyprenyltransferase
MVMSTMDPKQDRRQRRATDTKRERHPPTFRDRPVEAMISVLILALIGGVVAYSCTALTLN